MYPSGAALRTVPAGKIGLVKAVCPMPVLVLEDNLSRWRGLKRCLATQTDLMFVRCAVPPAEILTHCSRLSPCILVIDEQSLNEIDPQRLLQTIDFGRSVRVLVKVSRDEPKIVERLLRAGCMGVVAEGSAPSVLGHAIRALGKDEIWASSRFLSDFVRGLLSSTNRHNLTPREAQILELITQGRTNRGIAEELFISRETVRWHIRTLYAKIGVRDRTEATRYAARTE